MFCFSLKGDVTKTIRNESLLSGESEGVKKESQL
jgi:hypothetical protein